MVQYSDEMRRLDDLKRLAVQKERCRTILRHSELADDAFFSVDIGRGTIHEEYNIPWAIVKKLLIEHETACESGYQYQLSQLGKRHPLPFNGTRNVLEK